MDRKTRKVMTMNTEFHPKSGTSRLYVSRKRGDRALISCEECLRTEENSLSCYIENSNEEMTTNIRSWLEEKKMHGKFVRELQGVDWDKTWQWLVKGDLKGCSEALICSAQEQELRTNYIKFHIDKPIDSPLCRMRGEEERVFTI